MPRLRFLKFADHSKCLILGVRKLPFVRYSTPRSQCVPLKIALDEGVILHLE